MTTVLFVAICDHSCEHEGTCVGPNKCECREGWTGQFCQTGKKKYLIVK